MVKRGIASFFHFQGKSSKHATSSIMQKMKSLAGRCRKQQNVKILSE
jgi:hypothetical protein